MFHRIYLIHSNTSSGMLPGVFLCVPEYTCFAYEYAHDNAIPNRNYYAKYHIQNMNSKELGTAFFCECQKRTLFISYAFVIRMEFRLIKSEQNT